jgi:MYXO-CTERM domain-containing protein
MKRLLALSALSLALVGGASTARADVAPPDSTECTNKVAGDACTDDDMKVGACVSQTCTGLSYGGDAGPMGTSYACLICVAGAAPISSSGGCSLPAAPAGDGSWMVAVAALVLPLLRRRRREAR